MNDVTISKHSDVYCIPAGPGFSCLGFERAEELTNAIADWLKRPDLRVDKRKRGTKAGYKAYETALKAAEQRWQETSERCPVELTPQLIGLEGKRVEVVDKYGETRRFYVGKSMGWMPAHLEIKLRTSTGGCAVSGAPFKSIRIIGSR